MFPNKILIDGSQSRTRSEYVDLTIKHSGLVLRTLLQGTRLILNLRISAKATTTMHTTGPTGLADQSETFPSAPQFAQRSHGSLERETDTWELSTISTTPNQSAPNARETCGGDIGAAEAV